MSRNFETFFSQLIETNMTLDIIADFAKARKNVGKISIKLHQLNYLIGKEDLWQAVYDLFNENSAVFDILGILTAVHDNKKVLTSDGETVLLDSYFTSPEKVFAYITETGLAEIFQNKEITNLVDYIFGVEIGMDSHSRKNRTGKNMAATVARMFDAAGVTYRTEVRSTEFLDIISLGVDVKRFDFVIKTAVKTYLIETNFYNSSGSKLNETARSYSDIAPKINQYPAFEFVWITDGKIWHTAKNKLEEAFSIIPSLYNLTTLPDFIRQIKTEGILE